MESTQPKIGKYILNFGLLLGAIGVVFNLMLYFVDAHTTQSPILTVVNIAISVAVIFWGLMTYKKANAGYLKIGEALKMGAGVGLVSGIISIVYMLFLTNVLDPEYASKIMDLRFAEAVQQGNMTSDQIQQAKEMGMKFFWFSYPVIIIFSVIFGLIIGLVGGLIFKKSAEN